jgi:exodeoxyribonuclease X
MKFVRVVDFETTGTDPANADVIEVGWCDVTSDGTVGVPQSTLCRPQRSIEFEAMAVHHITEAEAASGVLPQLWQEALSTGDPVAFVAHSAKFESSFWANAKAPWICTYKSALRLWPDAPRHSAQVLRYWLRLGEDVTFDNSLAMPPHRAAPDAYVTAHIFSRMLKDEGTHRLHRLLQWSKEPGLLPKITFGKHAMSRWSDVPSDYLQWIGKQTDMDEDVRFTAAKELERRATR